MLDFLFTSSGDAALTPATALSTILIAFLLGGLISLTYFKTNRRTAPPGGFLLTMTMLPPIIALIILLVGSNVARAFSLAGAFSIIRFRSAPGEPKDITYIFFSLAAGLACGVGLLGYAALFTIVLCVLMLFLDAIKLFKGNNNRRTLKITVPENLNFEEPFQEILEIHTHSHQLIKIKTVDLGTLYELHYDVTLKNQVHEKELIDSLRCRNGNLPIMLSLLP